VKTPEGHSNMMRNSFQKRIGMGKKKYEPLSTIKHLKSHTIKRGKRRARRYAYTPNRKGGKTGGTKKTVSLEYD